MKNLLPVIIHYLYSGCISLYTQTPLTDNIYFSAELLQALFSKVNQFGYAKL